jgi:hypothetical protein
MNFHGPQLRTGDHRRRGLVVNRQPGATPTRPIHVAAAATTRNGRPCTSLRDTRAA